MFKESDKNTQSDLFGSMSCVLVGKALKVYGNEKGWHNQFRGQVVSRIDETPYKVLFNEGMGAPNAPIAILIGR